MIIIRLWSVGEKNGQKIKFAVANLVNDMILKFLPEIKKKVIWFWFLQNHEKWFDIDFDKSKSGLG